MSTPGRAGDPAAERGIEIGRSPHLAILLTAVSVLLGFGLAFVAPGAGDDGVFDWIISKAAVDGVDPYLPLSDLALEYGTVLLSAGNEAGPRTPGAILLAAPLTLFPMAWAPLVARLLVVVSAFGLALVVARIARLDWRWTVPFVPLFLLLPPASHALFYGNASMMVSALLAMSLVPRDDRWSTGVPLGMAIALRLWPGLIGLVLLLLGRRRTALGAGTVAILLNLGGLLLAGITPSRVLEGFMNSVGHIQNPANISLIRLLPVWAVGLVVAAFLLWAPRQEWTRVAPWSIPMALAASPVIWLHYLTVLSIPLALAAAALRSSRDL